MLNGRARRGLFEVEPEASRFPGPGASRFPGPGASWFPWPEGCSLPGGVRYPV